MGSEAARLLTQRDESVRVLVRDPEKATALRQGGVDVAEGDLDESASIDGAGAMARFRHITLPMLSPATLVASVTAFIGAFEIFTWPLIDTDGGPGTATQTILLYIYRSAFQNYRFGYSAVVSLVNILILVSFLVVMGLLAKKWVHYERV